MNISRYIRPSLLSLIFGMFFFSTLQAQVTIGVDKEPKDGSILDLKEKDVVGVNATKGLGLPRVNLTKRDQLYPMFENPSSPDNPTNDYNTTLLKDTEDEKHIGLTVYSINQCTLGGAGVYTWTGKEWAKLSIEWPTSDELLIEAMGTAIDVPAANGLAWHKDQDGNIFFSADFGPAGRWMVVNLRATKYDPVRTREAIRTVDANGKALPPLQGFINNGKYWPYYSTPAGIADDPRWGLSYSFAAASMNKDISYVVYEQGTDYTPIQGACPAKWYVPNDLDWTKLENEIITHTTQYADVPADIVSPLMIPKDIIEPYIGRAGEFRGEHNFAMMSPCINGSYGKSKMINPHTYVGFNAYSGGTNTAAYYWSSAKYGPVPGGTYGGWLRTFYFSTLSGVWKDAHHVEGLFHIRCKRDPSYPL